MDATMRPRIVFMGTPEFAATILTKVLDSQAFDVAGVYCQPDRPCGRGQKCTPPPVKRVALTHGLLVFQPSTFKDAEVLAGLTALSPDILLVAAYGLILPQTVLAIPRRGPWNVHASLLPRHRGAAPIQRAILAGETHTGITIMKMEAGLDTGPMLLARSIPIGPDETGGSLHDRLAELGGLMAVDALALVARGAPPTTPQDEALVTYAPKITRDDTLIRWDESNAAIHNRIRAMSPRPGAFFFLEFPGTNRRIRLQATPGRSKRITTPLTPPGRILGLSAGMLSISSRDGVYLIPSIKPDGKNWMDATSFACGYLSKLAPDAALSCPPPAVLARR